MAQQILHLDYIRRALFDSLGASHCESRGRISRCGLLSQHLRNEVKQRRPVNRCLYHLSLLLFHAPVRSSVEHIVLELPAAPHAPLRRVSVLLQPIGVLAKSPPEESVHGARS